MHSKCYPHITAIRGLDATNGAPFANVENHSTNLGGKWQILADNTSENIEHFPVYTENFVLHTSHFWAESEKSGFLYDTTPKSDSIADKLRWHRYRNSLSKREVAAVIGVDRSTYARYEEQGHDYYSSEHIDKLAGLYGINANDLLNEYNLFLYNGQGRQIRADRQARGMTQNEYASHLGVPIGTLKNWEHDRTRITKTNWERYFK